MELKKLRFKDNDIKALREKEIIIIFKNYEKLNSYDNLYVRNKLASWTKAKVIVTCQSEHFQHRDHRSCFLNDPSNPQLNSLQEFRIDDKFINSELETKIKELITANRDTISSSTSYFQQHEGLLLSHKKQAIMEEFNIFLKQIYEIRRAQNILKENIDDNLHIFISYAWEEETKALNRQQNHLRQVVQDLTALGFPAWLDVERMTGDIDQQMAGNIANSKFVLVIGTSRYAQRAMINTNVKKEYDAILKKAQNLQEANSLKVIPTLFTDEQYDIYLLPEKEYYVDLMPAKLAAEELLTSTTPTLVYKTDHTISQLIVKNQIKKITFSAEIQEQLKNFIKENITNQQAVKSSQKIKASLDNQRRILSWLINNGYDPFTDKVTNDLNPTLIYNSEKKVSFLLIKEQEQTIILNDKEQKLFAEVIKKANDSLEMTSSGLSISLKIYDVALMNENIELKKSTIYFRNNLNDTLEYSVKQQDDKIIVGIITGKDLPELIKINKDFNLENIRSSLINILDLTIKREHTILDPIQHINLEILKWLKTKGYKPFYDKLGNNLPAIIVYSDHNKITVLEEYIEPKIIEILTNDQPAGIQELIKQKSIESKILTKVPLDFTSPILSWLITKGCKSSHFQYIFSTLQQVAYCSLDFRNIDNTEYYITQLSDELIPNLLDLKNNKKLNNEYQKQKETFYKELKFIPGKYLLVDAGQEQIQELDIDKRLRDYIEAYGLKSRDESLTNRFDLCKEFEDFLIKKNIKTYVGLGRAGSGKSLFALSIFKNKLQEWHRYKEVLGSEAPKWLPIYISLKNHAGSKAEHSIEEALRGYELDDQDITMLKEGLGVKQNVLFILDGYDELGNDDLGHKMMPNFTEKMKDWPYAKLLITGRPEHFESDIEHVKYFSEEGKLNSFIVSYMSPFSPDEIKRYIEKYQQEETKITSSSTYEELQKLPWLMLLLDNPFLLNLVLQSLPQLLKNRQNSNNQKQVTRAEIYQAFSDTWFIKESNRHGNVSVEACKKFAEQLALEMFKNKSINVSREHLSLWEFFNNYNPIPAREGCPLRRGGQEYSYIHKSVFEYFLASYLWRTISEDLNSSWNIRSLLEESAVIKFLTEFYNISKEKEDKKRQLLKIIENSKTTDKVNIAAANAITVLNAAKVVFSGMDFERIKIPDADLTGAILDNTNLEGSDLRRATLKTAWLSNANMKEANMEGCLFGELAYKQFDKDVKYSILSMDGKYLGAATDNKIKVYKFDQKNNIITLFHEFIRDSNFIRIIHNNNINIPVISLAFSKDNRLLASSDHNNSIIIWDLNKLTTIQRIYGHSDEVSSIAFSPNSEYLGSGSQDCKVRIWELKDLNKVKILNKHTV